MVKQSNELVVIENQEPVVSTLNLAEGFEITHRAVLATIKKYEIHFQEIRLIDAYPLINKQGKASKFYKLNEEQSAFLGTLLKNNEKTVSFKRTLTREFFRIRSALSRILSQKQNAEWLEKRNSGKLTRREETDHIKRFVELAKAQGSQNAQFYYANFSKMQNAALFLFDQKYKNLRDVLSINQLSICSVVDTIVSRAISEGMEQALHYKEIWKLCKSRVEGFAAIHGKSIIPVPLSAPKQMLLEA